MIRSLVLKNFKSFAAGPPPVQAVPGRIYVPGLWSGVTVNFGGLSLIIGTNASGKSNIPTGPTCSSICSKPPRVRGGSR